MSGLKHQRIGHRTIKKESKISLVLWVTAIAALIWLLWAQNNLLVTNNFVYSSSDLPKSFVGYRVVHITDLYNTSLDVVSAVKKVKPDVILISGGYADAKGNTARSVKIIDKLTNIAPVFYGYGANDVDGCISSNSAIDVTGKVVDVDVADIDAESFIKKNYGDDILIKAKAGDEKAQAYLEYVREALEETRDSQIGIIGLHSNVGIDGADAICRDEAYDLLLGTNSKFTMGIVGNAITTTEVAKSRLNLAFTGGTYGTQRLSKTYVKGIYGIRDMQMFLSGGVGNPSDVHRIFNFPEIQCITLSDGTIFNRNPLEKLINRFWGDVGTIFDNDPEFVMKVQTHTDIR